MSIRLIPFVLVLAFGLAFCACREQPAPDTLEAPAPTELVVITPHGPDIQEAFTEGFRRWQMANNYHPPITLKWIHRGTNDAQRYVYDRFTQYPEAEVNGIGVDVFFGGGLAVHQELARQGYALPVTLTPELLAAIPEALHGRPLRAKDGTWHGTALGGLGILCNGAACEARGIAPPADWSDLASPRMQGWVVLADPRLSGSTAQSLTHVLVSRGWDQGFPLMAGIIANSNGLLPSSSMVAPNIEAGLGLAGPAAEFVARMSIAQSPGLTYVDPPDNSVTADPLTVLTGTKRVVPARAFLHYVLSPEGQALWALPPEAPGGPPRRALYHHPIRPDVYAKYAGQLVLPDNPFSAPAGPPLAEDEAAWSILVPHLVAAMARDPFLMQKAWRTATAEGTESPKLAALKAPPFDRATALEAARTVADKPQDAEGLEIKWAELFARRYREVLGLPEPPAVTQPAASATAPQ